MAPGAALLAGKALKFLPYITGTLGGIQGFRQGGIGGAITGGGMGALGGFGLGGPLRGLTAKGIRMAGSPGMVKGAQGLVGRVAPNLADVPAGLIKGNLQKIAAIGIPLAGVAGTAQLAGVGLGGGGNLGRSALSLGGYGTVGGEGMGAGGTPLPPGIGPYGNVSPLGDPLSVLSPLGLDAGRRLRSIKDAETLRDAQNILLPTIRKYAEQAKRDEFARDMAGAGIKQNILTNAALTKNMQRAGLNMGLTAAQQAGQALTARYNY
jgi:microcompartment protein CcmK/EutM